MKVDDIFESAARKSQMKIIVLIIFLLTDVTWLMEIIGAREGGGGDGSGDIST